jgi:gas vesicle structural protein
MNAATALAPATRGTASNYLQRGPSPSGLAEVLDLILDKGLVVDLYVRVSLVGIELLTIDARIVVASVDTYLRFAEAVNRLDLSQTNDSQTLPEVIQDLQEGGAKGKSKGVLEGAKDAFFGSDEDDDKEEKKTSNGRRSSSGSGSRRSATTSRKRTSRSNSK